MTPTQFAELAIIITRHAESLGGGEGAELAAMHRVWCRGSGFLQQWQDELRTSATPRLYAMLFTAELPLRIWCTAVTTSRDRVIGRQIAEAVYGELLDLRCLTLQALVADFGLIGGEAAAIDGFRRCSERWTDILIGPLARRTGITDFTFCPERALESAAAGAEHPEHQPSWPLIVAGLRLSFTSTGRMRGTVSPRLEEMASELAAAMLACFPVSTFGTHGCMLPPRMVRLGRIVAETPRPAASNDTERRPTLLTADVPVSLGAPRFLPGAASAPPKKRRPAG